RHRPRTRPRDRVRAELHPLREAIRNGLRTGRADLHGESQLRLVRLALPTAASLHLDLPRLGLDRRLPVPETVAGRALDPAHEPDRALRVPGAVARADGAGSMARGRADGRSALSVLLPGLGAVRVSVPARCA